MNTSGMSLAKTRATIAQKKAEIETIRSAPLPTDEAMAKLRAWVDANVAQFDPAAALSGAWTNDASIDLIDVRSPVAPGAHIRGLEPLFAWAMGEQIMKLAKPVISEHSKKSGAPMADRPALIEQLERDIDKLEHHEEWLVRKEGAPRRPGTRPELALMAAAALRDAA